MLPLQKILSCCFHLSAKAPMHLLRLCGEYRPATSLPVPLFPDHCLSTKATKAPHISDRPDGPFGLTRLSRESWTVGFPFAPRYFLKFQRHPLLSSPIRTVLFVGFSYPDF